MNLQERIEAFATLGKILRISLEGRDGRFTDRLHKLINNQHLNNQWFTPENVRMALDSIANELTDDNLVRWTSSYPLLEEKPSGISVGVIMAGNIPLVGFHDFISILITGNRLIAKTSSKDTSLIMFIGDILCSINQEFNNLISFTDGNLKGFDSIIATGSNNSARYFEYYFGKYPHIIRKNRNSVAVLDGKESENETEALGTDIFSYFGLGCRNVSKIYFPAGYDIVKLQERWEPYSDIISHNKYANNYDFNKAVYIVNKEKFIDFGFLLLKEDTGISSPVSVLFYEYYNSPDALKQHVLTIKDNIQCIVGKNNIPFGSAQMPHLWDYADGTDTIEFILKKITPGIL